MRAFHNGKNSAIDTMRGMYLLSNAILSNASISFGVTGVVTKINVLYIKELELVKYLYEIFGVKSISLDVIKPKREQNFKLLPDECVFDEVLDELENYPVSIKNIRRRKISKNDSEYCFLNTRDLFFVNEMGDVYPCPTLEGGFYIGDINSDKIIPFKVNNGICFARKVLFA